MLLSVLHKKWSKLFVLVFCSVKKTQVQLKVEIKHQKIQIFSDNLFKMKAIGLPGTF